VNGTYGYKIGTTASGYTWSGSPTKATINGAPASVAVKFTAKKGKVPAGLPEVTFGGVAPAVVVLGCWSGLGVGHSER